MTKDDAIARLDSLTAEDREQAHIDADDCLCEFLKSLGYGEVADAFELAQRRVDFCYF